MLEVSAVSSKLIFVKFENCCLILTLVIGQLSVSLLLLVLLLCPWFCLHSRASICLCSNLVLIFCIVCSPQSSNLSNAAFNQVFFIVFVTCSARVTLWTSGLALDICTFHLVYVWNEIWVFCKGYIVNFWVGSRDTHLSSGLCVKWNLTVFTSMFLFLRSNSLAISLVGTNVLTIEHYQYWKHKCICIHWFFDDVPLSVWPRLHVSTFLPCLGHIPVCFHYQGV